MSEKNLSESEWKKFAKSRDLKDAALVKALTALEKARSPADALAVLDEIEKQADSLRKSTKGDKELTAYLDGVDKALDKERKLNKAALKEAEASEDEEEESPALLTSKMISLVRQVKKGDEMQVLLANTGKEMAVLLSRRSISPSRRKLMTDYLGGGTPKFVFGICIFEENAYTFVVKTQAAGLAKKIKAALLAQVELRLKVRVRGEDPNDIDDDGGPAEDEAVAGQAEGTNAEKMQPTAPVAQAPADPLKGQYEKRMAALMPRILEALKARQGDATKIRAVAEFASEKSAGGNYKAALAALDALEKLMPVPAGVNDGEEPARDESELGRALSVWQSAREEAVDGLNELSDVIAHVKYKESDKAVLLLRSIRAQLIARPDTQRKLDELENYLKTEELIDHAEAKNGFGIQLRVRQPLLAALAVLRPHVSQ